MVRETTGSFRAWDVLERSAVTLEPGSLLSHCRIRRHSQAEIDSGADAYEVEFQADGRVHVCPLFRFQPRTRAVELLGLEEIPERHAIAV
jgi:hypothetical protein